MTVNLLLPHSVFSWRTGFEGGDRREGTMSQPVKQALLGTLPVNLKRGVMDPPQTSLYRVYFNTFLGDQDWIISWRRDLTTQKYMGRRLSRLFLPP